MTRPGASFLSLITSLVLPRADSSLTSLMPSIERVCTSSAMRAATTEIDVWYGISVTTTWSPPRPLPSSISQTARSRMLPLPVR